MNFLHEMEEVLSHLSVMATCSSMAEPVLVFQLPEIDVLLQSRTQCFTRRHVHLPTYTAIVQPFLYVHVYFVVVVNLLDADVVLGVNQGLRGGVRLGESHHTGNVLELT